MINIHKSQENAGIHLAKQGVDLTALPHIRVGLCLDLSGSMTAEYHQGHMQNALTHLLGMALHMTDSLDVFGFEQRAHQIQQPATAQNYENYINQHVKHLVGGGTEYANVIHLVYRHYFPELSHLHSKDAARQHVQALAHHGHGLLGKIFGHHRLETPAAPPPVVDASAHDPVLMLFLTDGDCFDEEESQHAIHAATGLPLFWSFVGLGHDSRFLKQMAQETDAEFVYLRDGVRISDDELYSQLITPKLTSWIQSQTR